MRKHFNLSVRLFQNFDCGCGIFQDTLTSVVLLQTNLHPSKFYESVGGQASQHSADGYMHTSWHAVIYPVLPCSWHAISILNLNYPACFQHANLNLSYLPYVSLGVGYRSWIGPSLLIGDSKSSSLVCCHAKIPLTKKKSGRDFATNWYLPLMHIQLGVLKCVCPAHAQACPKLCTQPTGPSSTVNRG